MASVLLVEDVAVVRTILRKFLESAGHAVVECEGGDEARRAASGREFDVFVTDLWMKGGDGLSFIAEQSRKGRAARVIAMTGGDPKMPGNRSLDLARQAGAALTLVKPITRTGLLAAIDQVLESANSNNVPA